jgi:hypothetical protein
VRRADGQPLPDVEAATRVLGHWYVATAQAPLELPATVVWEIEGSFAREAARVPRASAEVVRTPTRLARRSDGRAIGLVVDGPPEQERAAMMRWVLPIDLESWAVGDPEALGPIDFSDRTLAACAPADAGWVFDAPLGVTARIESGGDARVLSGATARLRVTPENACVERLEGEGGFDLPPLETRREGESKPTVLVALGRAGTRYPLRCTVRQP